MFHLTNHPTKQDTLYFRNICSRACTQFSNEERQLYQVRTTHYNPPIYLLTFRQALNNLFTLKDPLGKILEHIKQTIKQILVDYSDSMEGRACDSQTCLLDEKCSCAECSCCSVCTQKCPCPAATSDPNLRLAQILGFGDTEYK